MTVYGSFTAYDGVMALIVFFTVVHGYWKGATWQIAPIMSLVLGYMIAMPMSVTMAHYFGDPPQNRLFALVSIYIGVALIVYLMVRSFRAGIEKAKLTEFDRHIGALLGFVKGVLVTLAATVILLIYSSTARDLILKSESSTIAAKIINAVYPILPQALHTLLRPYLVQLKDELPIDLHESNPDGAYPDAPPSGVSPLSPTNSSARRRLNADDYVPLPNRRARMLVEDEEDDGLPAAPPPRSRSVQPERPAPTAKRQYDSAASTNRRYSTPNRDTYEQPLERPLTPTPSDDDADDPFSPRNSRRSTRSQR